MMSVMVSRVAGDGSRARGGLRERGGYGWVRGSRSAFVEPLRRYVMTYTALSPEVLASPAVSEDRSTGVIWVWRGSSRTTVGFEEWTTRMRVKIPNPSGRPALAILRRCSPRRDECDTRPRGGARHEHLDLLRPTASHLTRTIPVHVPSPQRRLGARQDRQRTPPLTPLGYGLPRRERVPGLYTVHTLLRGRRDGACERASTEIRYRSAEPL
jgi:hypothetical protein